jgi:hypothetical protein
MTNDQMQIGVLKPGAYSGLDIVSDTLKIKIFFNMISGILNLSALNTNKVCKNDFINTWDPTARILLNNRESKKSVSSVNFHKGPDQYAQEFDSGQALVNISVATTNLLNSLKILAENFKLWLGAAPHL